MNIEAYRKAIRRRMIAMMMLSLMYAAAMVAVHVFGESPEDFRASFLLGLASGVVICCVLIVRRYQKVMKDDKALRRLWNKEHDERMQAIRARAGAPMLLYTSAAMIAVALLIWPWHTLAATTLLLAAAAQLVVCAVTKLVCTRMM